MKEIKYVKVNLPVEKETDKTVLEQIQERARREGPIWARAKRNEAETTMTALKVQLKKGK